MSGTVNRCLRYYQLNAINRTIDAIAHGQDRILLVMATGTGKTFTAFQIILATVEIWDDKANLLLADRNILVDQTKTNDLKPFGLAMTKITKTEKSTSRTKSTCRCIRPSPVPTKRKTSTSNSRPTSSTLIVIDECHRGARGGRTVRGEILTTSGPPRKWASPQRQKETEDVSNIDYFGEAGLHVLAEAGYR